MATEIFVLSRNIEGCPSIQGSYSSLVKAINAAIYQVKEEGSDEHVTFTCSIKDRSWFFDDGGDMWSIDWTVLDVVDYMEECE